MLEKFRKTAAVDEVDLLLTSGVLDGSETEAETTFAVNAFRSSCLPSKTVGQWGFHLGVPIPEVGLEVLEGLKQQLNDRPSHSD